MSDKTPNVFKLLYLNTDGEHGLLPDYGTINAGGVSGPGFLVGGKPLMFSDGSSTDGSGVAINLTLQGAFDRSALVGPAVIKLGGGDLQILNGTVNALKISGATGVVSIGTLAVGAVTSGLINGVDVAAQAVLLADHLGLTGIKHNAAQISVAGPLSAVTGSTVQAAISSIDAQLGALGSAIKTFAYPQAVPSTVWLIVHNKASINPVVSIYGTDSMQVLPDIVQVIDANTIKVTFNTPFAGRAVILLF